MRTSTTDKLIFFSTSVELYFIVSRNLIKLHKKENVKKKKKGKKRPSVYEVNAIINILSNDDLPDCKKKKKNLV